jgi:hypothetical protein
MSEMGKKLLNDVVESFPGGNKFLLKGVLVLSRKGMSLKEMAYATRLGIWVL